MRCVFNRTVHTWSQWQRCQSRTMPNDTRRTIHEYIGSLAFILNEPKKKKEKIVSNHEYACRIPILGVWHHVFVYSVSKTKLQVYIKLQDYKKENSWQILINWRKYYETDTWCGISLLHKCIRFLGWCTQRFQRNNTRACCRNQNKRICIRIKYANITIG